MSSNAMVERLVGPGGTYSAVTEDKPRQIAGGIAPGILGGLAFHSYRPVFVL